MAFEMPYNFHRNFQIKRFEKKKITKLHAKIFSFSPYCVTNGPCIKCLIIGDAKIFKLHKIIAKNNNKKKAWKLKYVLKTLLKYKNA